jgi:hypothetical protein
MAELVRDELEWFKGEANGIKIDKTRFTSIDEGFSNGAYFQRLVFTFK